MAAQPADQANLLPPAGAATADPLATPITPDPVQPYRPLRRDESLDIAKGFGILLVVLGHVLKGLIGSNFFPPFTRWPDATVDLIYMFHMPLFFLISGHLVSGKHRPVGPIVKRLLITIAWPYFLWSMLEGLAQVYLSRYTNTRISISILYGILWNPIVPYWFLYALFCCHILYLAIRRLSHAMQFAIAVAVFLLPLAIASPLLGHSALVNPQSIPLIVFEVVRAFLYYVLGAVTVRLVKNLGFNAAVIGTILYALLGTLYLRLRPDGATAAILVIAPALAGLAATLAWSRFIAGSTPNQLRGVDPAQPGILVRTLAFLGRYSMSIYVMHIFFTAAVRIALRRAGGLGSNAAAQILIATVAGTVLPLGINWIVSRLRADQWLGLQHMEHAG